MSLFNVNKTEFIARFTHFIYKLVLFRYDTSKTKYKLHELHMFVGKSVPNYKDMTYMHVKYINRILKLV